jgi:hypothetical protein
VEILALLVVVNQVAIHLLAVLALTHTLSIQAAVVVEQQQ